MSGQTGTLGSWKKPSVLPGFGLTLGYALFYLGIIVLLPLALGALVIAGLILGIVAGVKAYEGNYYRYPFIIRLIK